MRKNMRNSEAVGRLAAALAHHDVIPATVKTRLTCGTPVPWLPPRPKRTRRRKRVLHTQRIPLSVPLHVPLSVEFFEDEEMPMLSVSDQERILSEIAQREKVEAELFLTKGAILKARDELAWIRERIQYWQAAGFCTGRA